MNEHDVAVPCLEVGDLLTAVRLVTSECLPVHALPHVVAAINAFLDCVDLWTLPDAVKLGSERLVDRVMAKVDADSTLTGEDKLELYHRALMRPAAMGNLPIVQRLHGHNPDAMLNNVAVYAAMSGDLPLLKWLSLKTPEMFTHPLYPVEHVAFDIAAARGDFETVQWLVATFPDSAWSLAPAALGGNLELVKWLHEHANIDEMQRNRTGESMVGFILAVGHRHFFGELLDDKRKVLDNLKRGSRGGRTPSTTAAMDAAASKGHLHVLQWLSANRQEGFSAVTVKRALKGGHLHVLAWLSKKHFTELLWDKSAPRQWWSHRKLQRRQPQVKNVL
ncbi:hypothetical protein PF008_g21075 [Phytophthora fragariae]|uniref:Uncharacterized protein n=1 Tax=Phytophthora fragariae TaxID=53985 RepID=A0A6G0QXL5_9STRA|nr:hypothetical protein PF008_g21075 [Phytophthora fragariae]